MVVERRMGGGIVRDGHVHTVYLKWITNKDLLYSTGNPSQCYMAAWMGEEFGDNGCLLYACLSPFTVFT